MDDPREKIVRFLETENAFAVMGQLRKLGILTGEDIERATRMSRDDWLAFMKEKAGVADRDTASCPGKKHHEKER